MKYIGFPRPTYPLGKSIQWGMCRRSRQRFELRSRPKYWPFDHPYYRGKQQRPSPGQQQITGPCQTDIRLLNRVNNVLKEYLKALVKQCLRLTPPKPQAPDGARGLATH